MNNDNNIAAVQELVMTGNLAKINGTQKMEYYNKLCGDLKLNPLTKPFQLLSFQGKEILYATKDCTDQLRKINGVSITSLESKEINGVYVVTAKAREKHGRIDTATGAVTIANLKGDLLANALMKCETKAKRRVTLSISGLGFLDGSEIETMPGSVVKEVLPDQPQIEGKRVSEIQKDADVKPEITKEKYEETIDKMGLAQTKKELNDLGAELTQYILPADWTISARAIYKTNAMRFDRGQNEPI